MSKKINAERDQKIIALLDAGASQTVLAKEHGISRGRVHQIYFKECFLRQLKKEKNERQLQQE
jgi:hypothetical protein